MKRSRVKRREGDTTKASNTEALRYIERVGLLPTPTAIENDAGWAKRQWGMNNTPVERHIRDGNGSAHPDGPWKRGIEDELDIRLDAGYQTGGGNRLYTTIDGLYMYPDDVPTMTDYETYAACGNCKGSNGGCPGYAPLFRLMSSRSEFVFVIVVHIDYRWAFQYATPEPGWLQRRILKQLMYTDRLSDYYANRLRKAMKAAGGGLGLSIGNCEGCKPTKCTVTTEGYCSHPEKRTFSMEATGVDCDALHHLIYGEYLPWYYQGTNRIPTYMSRYEAFFCKEDFDYPTQLALAVQGDKSFIDIDDVPDPDYPTQETIVVPSGVHKGYRQYVYNDPGLVV